MRATDVDVNALRAAAEAAGGCGMVEDCTDPNHEWYGSGELEARLDGGLGVYEAAQYVALAKPSVVLGLLDRLQAAEAAVERVRVTLGHCELEHDTPGWVSVALRSALDGPQGDATGEVALGSTDEPREPQIAVQVCDHPGIDHDVVWSYCRRCPKCGVCKFIGHGPLCFDCYSASGAEGDHGGRRDGEGLA